MESANDPFDLNRFVMERVDPDNNHGRLYFTRGDCRWEITIGKLVLREGEWVALPLASIRATDQRINPL